MMDKMTNEQRHLLMARNMGRANALLRLLQARMVPRDMSFAEIKNQLSMVIDALEEPFEEESAQILSGRSPDA
jgi:hypothetical protein